MVPAKTCSVAPLPALGAANESVAVSPLAPTLVEPPEAPSNSIEFAGIAVGAAVGTAVGVCEAVAVPTAVGWAVAFGSDGGELEPPPPPPQAESVKATRIIHKASERCTYNLECGTKAGEIWPIAAPSLPFQAAVGSA